MMFNPPKNIGAGARPQQDFTHCPRCGAGLAHPPVPMGSGVSILTYECGLQLSIALQVIEMCRKNPMGEKLQIQAKIIPLKS